MAHGDNCEFSQYNRRVRKLCNKAATGVSYHDKYNNSKYKDVVLFSGGDINAYLELFGSGYSMDSKIEITIDKEYYVCASFKQKIIDAVDARKRTSDQIHPEVRTPIVVKDKTSLRVVFDFDNGQEEYKEVTYNDELEDDKEKGFVELDIVLIF